MNIETIANKNKLDETQTLNLKRVYLMYELQKQNIKPGSFHEAKYNTYEAFYFVNEIKKGKTPLEIMNNIITACDEYSTKHIIEKYVNNMKN